MGRAGVLLDRDGTIIADTGYVGSVERVEFLDGAAEAIARLNRAGLPVAVVTNQAGVARGFYTVDDVEQVHKHMTEELARHGAHVDLWLYCPYHPDGVVPSFARASEDRKPAPGMAIAAARALDLDLSASWVVGDSPTDVGLAGAVGARAVYVGEPLPDRPDVLSVPDLATAAAAVIREHASGRDTLPAFPCRPYGDAAGFAADYGERLARALRTVDPGAVAAAADLLAGAYARDAVVFACGNGGSASIANHLQCDHGKGIANGTDLRNRVVSLSSNVETLTAIANDLGYEEVFEHQLSRMARPGDVVVVISSSGGSPNVVRALTWAKAHGVGTVALTGFAGGPARRLADVAVHVDAHNYGVVEDAHQACMHLLAQYIRQSRMAADAVAVTTF